MTTDIENGHGNVERAPLMLPPGLRLHTRDLLKAYVNHSKSTGLWITTINTEEFKPGAKGNKPCLKAFSFRNEYEAKETAYVNAPPTMMPHSSSCFNCDTKYAKILRRPFNCANCGASVCNSCTVKWNASMLPDTYKKKNTKTVKVCVTCDYLATSFREAIQSAHFERAKQIYMTGNINLRCPFMNMRKGSEIMLPIHYAVESGDLKTLTWLVDMHYCPLKLINTGNRSKQMNTELIKTSRGRTVIDIAIENQRIDILKYLVNNKNISLSDGKNEDKASLAALEVVLRSDRDEDSENDDLELKSPPIPRTCRNHRSMTPMNQGTPRGSTGSTTPINQGTPRGSMGSMGSMTPTNQTPRRSMTPTRSLCVVRTPATPNQRTPRRSMTPTRRSMTPTNRRSMTPTRSLVRTPSTPLVRKTSRERMQKSCSFDFESPRHDKDVVNLQTPPIHVSASTNTNNLLQERHEIAPPMKPVSRLRRMNSAKSGAASKSQKSSSSLSRQRKNSRNSNSLPRPLYNSVGPYDEDNDNDDKEERKICLDDSDCDESVATTVEDECIICCVKTIDACFTPCGHQVSCLECSRKVSRCPICSVECNSIRIFKP